MRDEMRVLGEIFNQKDRALKTLRLLKRHTNANTRANKKYHAKTLDFIYRPKSRHAQKGGVGSVSGVNTPESYIIEKIANAKNAFSREKFMQILVSQENKKISKFLG